LQVMTLSKYKVVDGVVDKVRTTAEEHPVAMGFAAVVVGGAVIYVAPPVIKLVPLIPLDHILLASQVIPVLMKGIAFTSTLSSLATQSISMFNTARKTITYTAGVVRSAHRLRRDTALLANLAVDVCTNERVVRATTYAVDSASQVTKDAAQAAYESALLAAQKTKTAAVLAHGRALSAAQDVSQATKTATQYATQVAHDTAQYTTRVMKSTTQTAQGAAAASVKATLGVSRNMMNAVKGVMNKKEEEPSASTGKASALAPNA